MSDSDLVKVNIMGQNIQAYLITTYTKGIIVKLANELDDIYYCVPNGQWGLLF